MEQIPDSLKNFHDEIICLKKAEAETKSAHFENIIPTELTHEDEEWYRKMLEWKNKDMANLSPDEEKLFRSFIEDLKSYRYTVFSVENKNNSRKDFTAYLANGRHFSFAS